MFTRIALVPCICDAVRCTTPAHVSGTRLKRQLGVLGVLLASQVAKIIQAIVQSPHVARPTGSTL